MLLLPQYLETQGQEGCSVVPAVLRLALANGFERGIASAHGPILDTLYQSGAYATTSLGLGNM